MRPLLVLLLLSAPLAAQDLAGSYAVKEMHREGKAVADDVRKGVTGVTIAGGKLTFTQNGKEVVAKVKTDAAKKPAEIDLFPQTEPFEKERAFKGIFELKGTTLTITYVEDGERPKDFATDARTSTKLVLEKK
jgi:uncharacterized protein (TIGR03067 family)